jgi:hypothetical protein
MARGRFRELDDFGGLGANSKAVEQVNEAAGKRWYTVYYTEGANPPYSWQAQDESGVLKLGVAPSKVEASNAAVVAMRGAAVAKGLIPASSIAPKPVPVATTAVVKAVTVTPAVVVKPTMTDIKFWV